MNEINKNIRKVDTKLSIAEVNRIAKETAKVLGSEFSVTKDSVDTGSFDLDYMGEKYDGGSYLIMDNGDVVNVALPKSEVYYNYKTKKKADLSFNGGYNYEVGGGVGLIGNQKRIDMNKNGRIDAEDFKILRSSMNGAYRKERKYVNHDENYEIRYAKPRPKRTGYKGKRAFDDGGTIDAFTIRMVKGVSGKPNEVVSDPRQVKFATGGGVEYVSVSQKISKKDKDEFLEYLNEFYGKKGLYADDLKGGFSKAELRKAMNTYLQKLGSAPTWGYGDSVDRERVRQILQPSYKMYAEGGFMSRLLSKNKEPKGEVRNDDIDLSDDKKLRLRPSTTKTTLKENEWMMKHNSSREARAYAGGGKVTFKEKATAIAKKFEGKRVEPKYQKEYGKTYDKEEAKEVGNKIAGSQKAKYDAKAEKGAKVKKGSGNHRMKEVSNLAKKIRKDGEKWTDAIKRAYQQLK